MKLTSWTRKLLTAAFLSVAALTGGCDDGTGSQTDDITDIDNSTVERQSIGNCWLYATASWAESINKTATGTEFDISQSYWTYWHWYDQIVEGWNDEIETGGSESVSFQIIRERGLIAEADFIPEDTTAEMSSRQSSALAKINSELKSGKLSTSTARTNRKLVRQVLDEAWGLSADVKTQLNTAFGTTGKRTFLTSATKTGTKILRAKDFKVRYPERVTNKAAPTYKDTTLAVAVTDWRTASYPWNDSSRRDFQIRVQKAMHDGAPVIITWDVDFNAMESGSGPLKGSFNLETLKNAGGPGRQGGHMTVLEDYEATTEEFGELKAGVTLDPENPDDAAKLAAALEPSTTVKFWRIKNSWGALRDDRASAPGFPGYHDLYQSYLDGPIKFCPSVEGTKTAANCTGTTEPWSNVILPPGY
ncbi:MAG: hypothetical protein IPM79_06750 [Polyangiaceae bacterium]|nr:hypothetical protein [Polyangiaceae bacterium]MBK8937338.1 hypothetical protein [Polyangiaceae bacterium]